MKKTLALLICALMLVFAFAGCGAPAESAADTSLDDVMEKGYFILGLDDAFPPMGYRDAETNEIIGFDIDLAKAVAAEMGIEVKLQPVVWENISMEINNKNVDVIWNGCTITPERQEVFDFSEPYMKNSQVVVVLDDSAYASINDLAGKQIGTQSGSASENAINANPDFANAIAGITGYATFDKALMDLEAGRIEAVVADATVFGYYYNLQPGTFRALPEDLGSEEFGIAFHKEADAFRAALQEALDTLIENGTAAEISNKWFGYDVTK